MTVRNHIDRDDLKKAREQFGKLGARIYVLWLVGIAIGVVGLKLDKVQVSSVTFHIDKPEVIPGLFFIGVCICYLMMVFQSLAMEVMFGTFDNRANRRFIYLCLGTRKTLIGLNTTQISIVKRLARGLRKIVLVTVVGFLLLPLIQILVFERQPLLDAFLEIVSVNPGVQ